MRTALTSLAVMLLAVLSGSLLMSQSRGRQSAGPPDSDPLARALDTDRNGEISAAEIQGAAGALKSLDRNGDGKLTGGEIGRRRRNESAGGRAPPGGPNRATEVPSVESTPTSKDSAEKKILGVLDDLDRNQRRGNMNVPKDDGRLLRILTETVGAKRVVEIGTSNGYSGIWLSLALRKTGGELITHELNDQRAIERSRTVRREAVSHGDRRRCDQDHGSSVAMGEV